MSLISPTVNDWREFITIRERLAITQAKARLRREMRIGNSRISALREAEKRITRCVRFSHSLGMSDPEMLNCTNRMIERLIDKERLNDERLRQQVKSELA